MSCSTNSMFAGFVLDIEQGARRRADLQLRSDKGFGFVILDLKFGRRSRVQFAPEHASRAGRAFHAEDAPIISVNRLVTIRPMPVSQPRRQLLAEPI